MKTNSSNSVDSQTSEGTIIKQWLGNSQHPPAMIRSNKKYCQQYSFNRHQDSSKQQSWIKQQNNRLLYKFNHNFSQQFSILSQTELFKKYDSIYNELMGIQDKEIIRLFLEEIQQNQANTQKINQQTRCIQKMQDQIIALKASLQKKRETIAKLCHTQTFNLNLIQVLQKKINTPDLNVQSHFETKCRQLQAYINEFIQSTDQMKEQLMHKYKIIKGQNQRLSNLNDRLNQELLEKNRKMQMFGIKLVKSQKSNVIMKQKQVLLNVKIQSLEEERESRLRQVENLSAELKHAQQFQTQLTIQNKELSNQLDFIRQKINQNQRISIDLFHKMEQQSQQLKKTTKQLQKSQKQVHSLQTQLYELKNQKEKLEILTRESSEQRVDLQNQKENIILSYQQIRKECDNLKMDNNDLIELIDEKDKELSDLRQTLANVEQDYSKLQQQFCQQSDNKQMIKNQLIQLAKQVKFMQSTYEKQSNQNEQIKMELQSFWNKNKKSAIKQICLNDQDEKRFSKGSNNKSFQSSQQEKQNIKFEKCWKKTVN